MREVNLRALDLNLLVLLDALLETRSVTRAAEVAHISQPAMSRALQRLRAMVGDPLLARGPDGYVPTPRAESLKPRLRQVLAEIRGLVAQAPFSPARYEGQLTVATTDHQTILLLPFLMERLAREAPNLDVTVVPILAATLDRLGAGGIDLAFGLATADLAPSIRSEGLYRDRFVTLLREDHPALRSWTLETYLSLKHVLVTVLGDGRGAVDGVLESRGLRRRIALRLPHFYAAIAILPRSDLVVTLPASIALRYAQDYRLAVLEPPLETPVFTVASLWPDALDADPASRWVRSIVREEAGRIEGVMPLRPPRPSPA